MNELEWALSVYGGGVGLMLFGYGMTIVDNKRLTHKVERWVSASVLWPLFLVFFLLRGVGVWTDELVAGKQGAEALTKKQRRDIEYQKQLAITTREATEAQREYQAAVFGTEL